MSEIAALQHQDKTSHKEFIILHIQQGILRKLSQSVLKSISHRFDCFSPERQVDDLTREYQAMVCKCKAIQRCVLVASLARDVTAKVNGVGRV